MKYFAMCLVMLVALSSTANAQSRQPVRNTIKFTAKTAVCLVGSARTTVRKVARVPIKVVKRVKSNARARANRRRPCVCEKRYY